VRAGGRDNPPETLHLVPIWCQKKRHFGAFCCLSLPLVANQQKARELCIHTDSRAFKSGDPNGIRIARTDDFRTIIGGLEVFHY
jgi:hypothetical protein